MKKIVMMLAIAVCAVSAQAAKTLEYASGSLGYQLREGPNNKKISDYPDQTKYISIYSLSASTLASKTGYKQNELTCENVGEWLNKSFADNSKWFTDNTSANWTVAEGARQWLTDAEQPDKPRYALIAGTEKGVAASVAANEWVLTLYHDDNSDYFRIAHAIEGGTGDAVKDSGNDLKLPVNSFVVFNGDKGSLSEWGKWTAANVPEPTSGLLMLLGLASLALKRKRA